MQRSPLSSVTLTLRYSDFSVCSTTICENASRAPRMPRNKAANVHPHTRSKRIAWFPADADDGENRRNYRQRPDDLIDFKVEHQIKRGRYRPRGAAERRHEIELARAMTALPCLVDEKANRIRRHHAGDDGGNKKE